MQETERPVFPVDHVAIIRDHYKANKTSSWGFYEAFAAANRAWHAEPTKREKLKQLKDLFPPSEFSKYAQIGADERLKDPRLRELLPPKYSIICEVKLLSDEELDSFKRDREERRGQRLGRRYVQRFRKSAAEKARHREVKLPDVFCAAVRLRRQLTDTELDNFHGELSKLALKYDLEVVQPADQPLLGEYEKALRFMRREAKKFVQEQIKLRKAKLGPGAPRKKALLLKRLGFPAEEVEIGTDADEERIQAVLETLGSGDQFGLIRKAAYERFPCEQQFKTPRWLEAVADEPPTFEALLAEAAEIKAPPISSFGTITGDMKKAFEDFK
jgi:hypothetical protein